MSLDKAMQNLKYDARLIEFNLNNGLITKQELEAYLKSLPDSSNNQEPINLEDSKEDRH